MRASGCYVRAIVEVSKRQTTAMGVRALALTAAGIAAVTIVAAAPGSPYQPRLIARGQPHGIVRDVAVWLHLDRIPGNPLLAAGVFAMVLATAGFLFLLRAAFREEVSVRAVAVAVVAAHCLLLLVPLLFSRDVYSYAYYGKIAGIYHGNPYVQTPLDHSGDALWNLVGPQWVNTPAYYGPGWTSLSALLSRSLPRAIDLVEAYRYLAIVASLATCAVIVWIVHRLWPARKAFALVAFGANPVVLFFAVGGGHSDLLVALSIVGAFAFLVSKREMPAIAVLSLGALIKVTAALPLLLLLVWCVARRPPVERRRTVLTHGGLSLGIALLFALPYLQLKDPTLGMLGLAGQTGWLAPPLVIGRAVDAMTFHTMGWVVRLGAFVLLAWCVGLLVREVWRRAAAGRISAQEQAAVWGWALALLMLLGPILLPWYAVWGLPLVWALPRIPRTAVLAASAMLGVTLWSAEALRYPGAFELNKLVGFAIVVPILTVFLVFVVRDLRSRIELGRLFEDEVGRPAPTTLAGEPGEEQRVPDASRHGGGDADGPLSIQIGADTR
jgi:Glycosyltransferase family 87